MKIAFVTFLACALLAVPAAAATAPDCALKIGGQVFNLRQFRGKVVYVDFWASWCAPCVLSFPFMNELSRNFASRGLQVVGVGMDQKPEDAQRFLAGHAASFAVALGDNAQCARDFGVAAMPSSFLVDRSGIIRYTHQGFRPGDAAELSAHVEQLLNEKPAQ